MMKKPNSFLFYCTLHYGLLREAVKMPEACSSQLTWCPRQVWSRRCSPWPRGTRGWRGTWPGPPPAWRWLPPCRCSSWWSRSRPSCTPASTAAQVCVLELSTVIRVFKVSQCQEKAPPCWKCMQDHNGQVIWFSNKVKIPKALSQLWSLQTKIPISHLLTLFKGPFSHFFIGAFSTMNRHCAT